MTAEIQNNITTEVPFPWYEKKVTDETDPTGVYSPLKDLIGNSKPTPIRVSMQVGNGKTFLQTNTGTELNGTEKKLESILYNHLPKEAKSWLKSRCEENIQKRKNISCAFSQQQQQHAQANVVA